jgi:hypothetical protein
MKSTVSSPKHDENMLDEIRSIFELSESELADLFRIRRQSIAEWRTKGVPAARRATFEHVVGLARTIGRELIASHIAEAVRTPDPWLANRTILQTIAQEGPAAVDGYLARLFSYSGL